FTHPRYETRPRGQGSALARAISPSFQRGKSFRELLALARRIANASLRILEQALGLLDLRFQLLKLTMLRLGALGRLRSISSTGSRRYREFAQGIETLGFRLLDQSSADESLPRVFGAERAP